MCNEYTALWKYADDLNHTPPHTYTHIQTQCLSTLCPHLMAVFLWKLWSRWHDWDRSFSPVVQLYFQPSFVLFFFINRMRILCLTLLPPLPATQIVLPLASCIPCHGGLMTPESKHQSKSFVLKLFLADSESQSVKVANTVVWLVFFFGERFTM